MVSFKCVFLAASLPPLQMIHWHARIVFGVEIWPKSEFRILRSCQSDIKYLFVLHYEIGVKPMYGVPQTPQTPICTGSQTYWALTRNL